MLLGAPAAHLINPTREEVKNLATELFVSSKVAELKISSKDDGRGLGGGRGVSPSKRRGCCCGVADGAGRRGLALTLRVPVHWLQTRQAKTSGQRR